MSILSVPLYQETETAMQNLLNLGYASNRAEIARKAIMKAAEDAAVAVVLESEQCVKEGKLLHGDLSELMKKL
ncbi:MAG: hypothetical protein NTZ80_04490 [Patescibacteria group bacterium]|nr:hypothetical protein [Patescibacteria group bacterium]